MTELKPKLKKTLARLQAAGGTLPWDESPRQFRQLAEAGFVCEGNLGGGRKMAVLITDQIRKELDE